MPVAINALAQRSGDPIGTLTHAIVALSSMGLLPGEAQEKLQALRVANEINRRRNQPGSQESQLAQEEYKARLAGEDQYLPAGSTSKLHELLNQDSLSAAALDKNPEMTALGSFVRGEQAMKGMQARNQVFVTRTLPGISKEYENIMRPYRTTQEDIARIESILNTKDTNGNPLITRQQLGDANAAIARVFSPNHMSDATVSRTEYESLPGLFAGASQKLLANPTDIGSRQLIEHIIDQAHHIGNVTNKNALQELQSLDAGYAQVADPSMQQFAAAKSAFFKQRFAHQYPERGALAQPGMSAPAVPGDGIANASESAAAIQSAARAELARRKAAP